MIGCLFTSLVALLEMPSYIGRTFFESTSLCNRYGRGLLNTPWLNLAIISYAFYLFEFYYLDNSMDAHMVSVSLGLTYENSMAYLYNLITAVLLSVMGFFLCLFIIAIAYVILCLLLLWFNGRISSLLMDFQVF